MSAFSVPSIQRRHLKKSRLGPPDVYPQDSKQKEDELSAKTLKEGFVYNPVANAGDEYGSARPSSFSASSSLSAASVSAYFNGVFAKKEEYNTIQDSNKKRPVNNRDQFMVVGPPNKISSVSSQESRNQERFVDNWFVDLAGSKPLQSLNKKIPVLAKRDDVFTKFFENDVAYVRAAWYIKLMGAYAAIPANDKGKKKQVIDPYSDWTVSVQKLMKDLISRLAEHYRLVPSDKPDAAAVIPTTISGIPSTSDNQTYDKLYKQYKYHIGLTKYLYDQGLLGRDEMCSWIVDLTEKVRTQGDGGLMKLVIPWVYHFMIDILHSEILSRKLATTVAKYLSSICSPVARGPGPQKAPLQLLEEALECGHHVVPVRCTTMILHTIILQNPAACMWNFLGDDRANSPLDGSPLDHLAVFPSDLPIGPAVDQVVHDLRGKIKIKENEIMDRSAQAECHWVITKETAVLRIANVWTSLTALEALDRYSFHRCDAKDNMDALYGSVFCSIPPDFSIASGTNWKADVEPLLFLLCHWAVSTRRTGLHRGMVIAALLERFQAHLLNQAQKGDESSDCVVGLPTGTFLFQDCLMRYLDEEGPKFENNGQPADPSAFENLMLLMTELISRSVFSHDAYVCALISTGIIPQAGTARRPVPPVIALNNMVPLESPRSQQEQSSYIPQMSPGSLSVSTPGSVGYFDGSGLFVGEDYQRRTTIPQSPLSHGLERKAAIPGYLSTMQSAMYPPHPHMQGPHPHMPMDDSATIRAPMSADFGAESYDKPASVSSVTSEPPVPPLSPHFFYVLHFPITTCTDVEGSHEANQRAVLLFGFGRAREQARHASRKLQKDIQKLFSKKGCYDVTRGPGKGQPKADLPATYANLRQRFMSLPYFDRHIVSNSAMALLLDALNNFWNGTSSYIPAVDNIIFAMQIMESAFNLQQLLNCVTQLLGLLKHVENALLQKLNQFSLTDYQRQREPNLSQTLLPPVILYCVGILRKYHCCLLLSQDLTDKAFCGLRTIVANVGLPGDCTSAERCVLAYMYDLYQSCAFLQARYRDSFNGPSQQIRNTIMWKTKPSQTAHLESRQTREFIESIIEFINNPHPKSRPSAEVVRRLAEPANQHFFVVNCILKVTAERDPDVVNELAIFCAEMTACCSGLTAEWLAAFRAFILTFNKSENYHDDLVKKIDVTDNFVHEQIAVFCCVLIARHCIRLEDFIGYVALMTLMMASKCQDDDQALEISGRLAAHVMFRLLQGSYGPPEDPMLLPHPVFYLKYSWDRCLLISARRNLGVAPLLAVLKAMLVLSDSDVSRDSHSVKREWNYDAFLQNYKSDNTRPFGADIEGLSDFARVALREICQEDTTRECVLKELENLFSTDLLLDPIMSMSQTRHLVHLICYPVNQAGNAHPDERLDDKQAIQRILRSVDQWNLRVSWVELKLMLDQSGSAQHAGSSQERGQLIDIFAKGVIDAFQLKTEISAQSKKGKAASTKYELDVGEHVWYLAPLIAKLDTNVQIKILRQAISVMENCSWSVKGKERDKLTKSALLLGHPPFVSILTTCLTKSLRPDQQEEQREALLRSLLDQLSLFSKEERVYSSEDAKLRPLLLESLTLRLSLAGSLFDIIQKKVNVLQEWTFLLAQLITSGCVDPVGSPDPFITVMDMLTVLMHTAYTVDPATPGMEERKLYLNLVKRIRKEIGEKLIPGVEWVKMLLPLAKKTMDVLVMEPAGTVFDAKGNKVTPHDLPDKKQGLQVACRAKLNPWEVLEGFRNPFPLSWAFFQTVRLERKILTSDLQHRLLSWHTHQQPKPIEYYLEAPPAPADDDVPSGDKVSSDEPATSETTSVDTASPRSPRSRQTKAKKTPGAATKNKRKTATALMGMHGGTVTGGGYMAPGPSGVPSAYGDPSGMMMPQGVTAVGQSGGQWYGGPGGQPGMPMPPQQRVHFTHGQPGGPQGPMHGMGMAVRPAYMAQDPGQGRVRPGAKAELHMMLQNKNQQSNQGQPPPALSYLLSQQQQQQRVNMPSGSGAPMGHPGQPSHPSYMTRQGPGGISVNMNMPGAGGHTEADLIQRQRQEQDTLHRMQQLRQRQQQQQQAAAMQQAQQQQANQAAQNQAEMVQRQNAGYANFAGGNMTVGEHSQQPQQQMQSMYVEQQHHPTNNQNMAGGSMMTMSGVNPAGGQYNVMHQQQNQPAYHQGPSMGQGNNMNMPPEYIAQYHPQQNRPDR